MDYKEKLLDPRWQRKRLEILSRDNFICTCCGDDKETLHVHHFKYNGEPWDVDSSLLVTFCATCHWAHEFYKDFIIRKIEKVKKNNEYSVLIIYMDADVIICSLLNGEMVDNNLLSYERLQQIYNNKPIINGKEIHGN